MKLSTRTRYAARALVELALQPPQEAVGVSVVAHRQALSAKYLESVFAELRRAGLVRAVRGAQGGYLLARPAATITLREIFELFEGRDGFVPCTTRPEACERARACVTRDVWARLYDDSLSSLEGTTLADLAARDARRDQANYPEYTI